MAVSKGLIFLDSKNAILHEQLNSRIIDGKREPCEITFSDFDDVSYKITSLAECPNIVKVSIQIRDFQELMKHGTSSVVESLYPGAKSKPEEGYDFAIEFDCNTLSNPTKFLTDVCELKRNILSGPLFSAFTALKNKESEALPAVKIHYRKTDIMFVCPSASKVTVIFLVDFVDTTDKALAKIFLQEFVEAQRLVRTAPPVSYSKEPPMELASARFAYSADSIGFLSFALEERHIAGDKINSAITMLTGFRPYLHYHIKCSKTYLHMRMRKKVAGWMQILNRAIPEVETEKKTMGGKTFVRK